MNTEHTDESAFVAALASFEASLETPIVPGELPAWLAAARAACRETGELLHDEVNRTHRGVLTEIAQQDLSLAPRIQDLKEKDELLQAECHEIYRELEELCRRAEQTEPHEAKLNEEVSHITCRALSFVIEARKQEAALTTWHIEAFNRDRGVAD